MNHRLAVAVIFLIVCFTSACNHWVPRFGIGGRYEEGREQFLRGRGGDLDTAIVALESVVSVDPALCLFTYQGRRGTGQYPAEHGPAFSPGGR